MKPVPGLLLGTVLLLAACGGGGPGAARGVETEPGVRKVGDTTIVQDSEGPSLVIDANGCQAIVPAAGGPAEVVRDSGGAPVCAGPQAAEG